MWCVYVCMCVCVCASVSHLYGFGLLDAASMVKEAERWKQVPSQHECVEEAPIHVRRYQTSRTAREISALSRGFPLIPPLLSHFIYFCLSSRVWVPLTLTLSHTHTHTHTHTLMGVIFFIAPLLVSLFFLKPPLSSLLLTASLYSPPVSSSQNYSSRLRADVCVREHRLLRQAPAARCLCGACRGPCYHHSRASRRPFHYARVPFRHRVAAAGKQVTKSNAQSRTGCVES